MTDLSLPALLDLQSRATKGPWRIGKTPEAVVADHPTGHDNPVTLMSYGGSLVCRSVRNPDNTALIAAAPELLAALIEALTELDKMREAVNATSARNRTLARANRREPSLTKPKGD